MVGEQSNSGVYFQGRYEVQILDSFGATKTDYPGNAGGGIYPRWLDNRNVGGQSPRTNASKPAGEWQTYDVVFRAPRFDAADYKLANACFLKVIHNGQLVQENVEVTGPTRAAQFANEQLRGPLMLQGDHGPVAFRNLRVRQFSVETDMRPFTNVFVAMDTLTKQKYPSSDFTLEQQLDLMNAAGYAGVTWEERSPEETKRLADAEFETHGTLLRCHCNEQ